MQGASSTGPQGDLRRERWSGIVDAAVDKPSARTLTQHVIVPVVTAIVTAVILMVMSPPFVCGGRDNRVSYVRILIWGLSAGALTAILTANGMFARFAKSC